MNLHENISRVKELMGFIIEQKTPSNVYTDKDAYEKALKRYENQMTAYLWSLDTYQKRNKIFQVLEDVKFEYGDRELNRKIKKITGFSLDDILWGIESFFCSSFKDVVASNKEGFPVGQKINKRLGNIEKDFCYQVEFSDDRYNLPVFKKPSTKPIYQPPEPTSKPTLQTTVPQKNDSSAPKPKAFPEGESVYGPGQTLIGTIKGKVFTPIPESEWSGSKINYFNKQDLELLRDKNKMNDYLKLKYGSYIIPLK